MAVSATPKTVDLSFGEALGLTSNVSSIAVAYSGGRDSTALLHACARAAQEFHAQGFALRVHGLHVHHGLSAQADAWLAHGAAQCEAWAAAGMPVAFHWRRLSGSPFAGQSVEAWARAGRYAALREMAQAIGADALLLAHHRRDQAETWLLQSLRGAGAAGLAGMPQVQWRDGMCWLRPWLQQPREAIEAYVAHHGLAHIEDDSNSDPRYARNRLRLKLWPAFCEAFPGAEANLAQAARWAQQGLALQQEMAEVDAAQWIRAKSLSLEALQQLSVVRASNLLRHWMEQVSGHIAPASLVVRLLAEAPAALNGARWPVTKGQVQKHRGGLMWCPNRSGPAKGCVPLSHPEAGRTMCLSAPGLYACPEWRGTWRVQDGRDATGGGVRASLLSNVILRPREGGEQFQRLPGTPPRSLKKAWQFAGVPSLLREGPLVYGGSGADAPLIWVPGLGLDARVWAGASEPCLRLEWLPDGPASNG